MFAPHLASFGIHWVESNVGSDRLLSWVSSQVVSHVGLTREVATNALQPADFRAVFGLTDGKDIHFYIGE